MFQKIFTIVFALFIIAFFATNVTNAQTSNALFNTLNADIQSPSKIVYPIISLSPIIGATFPIGTLGNSYKTSFVGGLDINLAVNRETSFFLNGSYFDLPAKTEAAPLSGASVIAITVGPRYTFSGPQLKAALFLEAGLGVYMFHTQDYTQTIGGVTYDYPSATSTNFGLNIGPGVTIPVGGTVNIILKVKLHEILASGGSQSYIAAVGGVDFRL
jgi:hypothetical protein